jgi:uncharacterized protein (DUF2225 family)
MILLVAALLLGDERKAVDVVCPVDGHKFQAAEVRSNRWGGVDTDFCPHAIKTTPLELYVWVCPGCRFAGRKADFEAAVAEEDKKALLEGLKPLAEIPKGARQDKISGWVKYDLMAQAVRLRKGSAAEIGRAYLNASWSARQQGAAFLDGFDEWETLYKNYQLDQEPMKIGFGKNRTEFDLDIVRKVEKDIQAKRYPKGVQRILAPYLAAYLYRKHGENAEAERWLGDVDALKGENSVIDDAAARMRASIVLERDFQRKAMAAYEPLATSPDVAYLMGELNRRTGERKAAAEWYQKALSAGPAEALKKLATEQKAKAEK